MKFSIPESILSQHTAVLGKTGSGKTSTEKLLIEQVVSDGFRVCVLDTVKSDWWGITSSASGKQAGLNFKILGGPHGHVPLHSSAGKVIGQLAGSGKLPLSIVDMADFEAGGIQKFFVEFAPALMRNAKGVIYLVIEEAHELAPKERAGFGAENLAIHLAKKLATAGRSKGIRLIVATQRVQALHNAVLGSCETIIAHRLTTPADQEPVVKWLRSNTTKETADMVAASLSSLPTGTGWLCSGEAKYFQKVEFPKFATYDNTSTPTGDEADIEIKTAEVDQEELGKLIGVAVEEAKANDPVELKREIARLKRALATKPESDQNEVIKEVPILTKTQTVLVERIGDCLTTVANKISEANGIFEQAESLQKELMDGLASACDSSPKQIQRSTIPRQMRPAPTPFRHDKTQQNGDWQPGKCERALLSVLAQFPEGCNRKKLILLAGYHWSGSTQNSLGRLRTEGAVVGGNNDIMRITELGMEFRPFTELRQGQDLVDYWLNHPQFGKCERELLRCFAEHPNGLDKDKLLSLSGYEWSGSTQNALGALRTAEVITGRNNETMRLSDELFETR